MALVGGPAGAFTYSTAGNDPVNAEVERWRMQTTRTVRNATPAGWAMDRHYVGRLGGRVRIWLSANDTEIAPLPAGLIGSCVLQSSTGETYTGKLTIVAMVHDFSSPDDFQGHVYDGLYSAENSTDTIVDTHA